VTDVLVADGRIERVGRGLAATGAETVIDGAGGALIPGLHDHHVHLQALAADRRSVDLRGRAGLDLAAALQEAAADRPAGEWVRAVGYREPPEGPADRHSLDAIVADHPVRVQHRSGALWLLNSAALDRLGLLDGTWPDGAEIGADGRPTGRLYRLDRWLADRIPPAPLDLASVGRLLHRVGITGVTDATPFATGAELERLAAAVAAGELTPHVTITGAPPLDLATVPPGLAIGPAKILLPDHALPTLDELTESIATARRAGRPVAIHCVTRVALVLILTALDEVGPRPGDRLEHGSIVPAELVPDVRRLGLTVVTQPNLLAARGDDYLVDVEPADRDHLWPCATLLAAGIAVAAGTDAPFGEPDPWRLVFDAVQRRTRAGVVVGPDDRLSPARALALLLGSSDQPGGPARRVAVGEAADLCLLGTPLAAALEALPQNPVRATIIAGRLAP
jgi:predicted amidohydrolase YtcJ